MGSDKETGRNEDAIQAHPEVPLLWSTYKVGINIFYHTKVCIAKFCLLCRTLTYCKRYYGTVRIAVYDLVTCAPDWDLDYINDELLKKMTSINGLFRTVISQYIVSSYMYTGDDDITAMKYVNTLMLL